MFVCCVGSCLLPKKVMHPVRKRFSDYMIERVGSIQDAGQKIFHLRNGANSIGRSMLSTINVNSNFSSRSHCTITVEGDQVQIADHVS